jgi:hypothetical protein
MDSLSIVGGVACGTYIHGFKNGEWKKPLDDEILHNMYALVCVYTCMSIDRVTEGGREGGVGLTMLDDQIFCILMKGVVDTPRYNATTHRPAKT